MSLKKKNKLPKIKKKLKSFLTDESGKITKRDALGISVGSAILLNAGEVAAAHSSTACGHANQSHANGYQRWAHLSGQATAHINTPINGHYSGVPNTGPNISEYVRGTYRNQAAVNLPTHCSTTHSNHSNHGNHSNAY